MTQTNQNVTMWAGDTKQIFVTVTDDDGDPKSLEGVTIRWVLQARVGDATPLLDKDNGKLGGITLSEAVGEFRIDLEPEDTEDLPPRSYYHEAEVTSAGNVSTVLVGTLTLCRSAA